MEFRWPIRQENVRDFAPPPDITVFFRKQIVRPFNPVEMGLRRPHIVFRTNDSIRHTIFCISSVWVERARRFPWINTQSEWSEVRESKSLQTVQSF